MTNANRALRSGFLKRSSWRLQDRVGVRHVADGQIEREIRLVGFRRAAGPAPSSSRRQTRSSQAIVAGVVATLLQRAEPRRLRAGRRRASPARLAAPPRAPAPAPARSSAGVNRQNARARVVEHLAEFSSSVSRGSAATQRLHHARRRHRPSSIDLPQRHERRAARQRVRDRRQRGRRARRASSGRDRSSRSRARRRSAAPTSAPAVRSPSATSVDAAARSRRRSCDACRRVADRDLQLLGPGRSARPRGSL